MAGTPRVTGEKAMTDRTANPWAERTPFGRRLTCEGVPVPQERCLRGERRPLGDEELLETTTQIKRLYEGV